MVKVKNCERCDEDNIVETEDGMMAELTTLIQEAVDYDNREIAINGEIDDTTFEKYIIPIINMNKEDDENEVPIEERKPIKLYIACRGGDVSMGLALVDIIQASKTPIWGINVAYAHSMGAIILLACHKRLSYKRASILIHDGYCGLQNSAGKVRDTLKYFDVLQDSLKELILERSTISKKLLNKNFANEWYITSDNALKYGMIDEIITTIV